MRYDHTDPYETTQLLLWLRLCIVTCTRADPYACQMDGWMTRRNSGFLLASVKRGRGRRTAPMRKHPQSIDPRGRSSAGGQTCTLQAKREALSFRNPGSGSPSAEAVPDMLGADSRHCEPSEGTRKTSPGDAFEKVVDGGSLIVVQERSSTPALGHRYAFRANPCGQHPTHSSLYGSHKACANRDKTGSTGCKDSHLVRQWYSEDAFDSRVMTLHCEGAIRSMSLK